MGLRLNLGCGPAKLDHYTNVDRDPKVGPEQVVDLNKLPWPWDDGSVDEIRAVDILEHLSPLGRDRGQLNIIAIMGEIERVLKPDGVVEIMTPSTDGPGAFQDPTHVTFWNRNTFMYFVWPSPYNRDREKYPRFTIEDRDCGIADSDVNEFGITWAVARMKKLSPEKEAEIETKMAQLDAEIHEAAVEGADFNGGDS